MTALDRAAVVAALGAARGVELAFFPAIDSTNRYLLDAAAAGAASGACLAAAQTAGRGRRGKRWRSPEGNIYLSLLWRFDRPPAALGGLSLAAGVAVMRALRRLTPSRSLQVGLKWPNDVLWRGRKLAGVLVECGAGNGSSFAVLGVGINVAMPAGVGVDQPWVDLNTVTAPDHTDPNRLAAALLDELYRVAGGFAARGLACCVADWRRYDLTRDRQVSVRPTPATAAVTGTACGVDHDGALLLDTPTGRRRLLAGEVSLRLFGPKPAP